VSGKRCFPDRPSSLKGILSPVSVYPFL
jgi:hypothetical protein